MLLHTCVLLMHLSSTTFSLSLPDAPHILSLSHNAVLLVTLFLHITSLGTHLKWCTLKHFLHSSTNLSYFICSIRSSLRLHFCQSQCVTLYMYLKHSTSSSYFPFIATFILLSSITLVHFITLLLLFLCSISFFHTHTPSETPLPAVSTSLLNHLQCSYHL